MLAAVGHDLLESLEYEVVAETSVHRALNIFRESPDKFDLVITDMTMPHMNGLDFAGGNPEDPPGHTDHSVHGLQRFFVRKRGKIGRHS